MSVATRTNGAQQDSRTTEHLLGIFANFLRLLPADSAVRIRTLAKFVEGDYDKIARLVQVRGDYSARLGKVEREIAEQRNTMDEEEAEDMCEEWLSRRLDAGLFGIQTTDMILAWLCAEDGGARKKIAQLLEGKGGMQGVRDTLKGKSFNTMVVDEADFDRIDGIDGDRRT